MFLFGFVSGIGIALLLALFLVHRTINKILETHEYMWAEMQQTVELWSDEDDADWWKDGDPWDRSDN
jgi:hypothetical protein